MSPEELTRARLQEIAAVTAIVGSRIYTEKVPQRPTYPLVLVQLVHEPTSYHFRGGWRDRARVQVDGYVSETGSDPYGSLIALADAIHGDDAGSGLSGWVGSIGSPEVRITGILRIERVRDYEAEELHLLRMRQDYWIHFQMT